MGKRLPYTPRSQVRASLRRLWLRSRERQAALHRDGYRCQHCHRKQSRAIGHELKVEVHHLNGIEWERAIDAVYEYLLCHPDKLITHCPQCHDEVEAAK